MKVLTTRGLIERELLEVRDEILEDENCRVLATEWRLNGELVRRDVIINGLRPLEARLK